MASGERKKYSSDRRQRYKEMLRDGKVGPQFGKLGGRPRKKHTEAQAGERPTAASVIAAWARDHGEQMAQIFVDVVQDENATDREKIHAVKVMLGIESKEVELRMLEEAAGRRRDLPESQTREDLVADLAAKLNGNPLLAQRLGAALATGPADPDH